MLYRIYGYNTYTLGVKDYTKNGVEVTQKGSSFTSVGQKIVFGLLGYRI